MAMLSACIDGGLSWNSGCGHAWCIHRRWSQLEQWVWPCLVHTWTVVSAVTVGVAMLSVYIDGSLSWNSRCGHA